ncbi:MAG: hypothetical protein WCD45_03480, partial [Gallionella sp.]
MSESGKNLYPEAAGSAGNFSRFPADLLRTIVDAVPGIINVSDRAGRLLLWNRKLEIVSEYCAAEITQLHCQDFFTADD